MSDIKPQYIQKDDEWYLVDEDDNPIVLGSRFIDDKGDAGSFEGGHPPRHSSSSGRVFVSWGDGFNSEYFPHVFNLTWKHVDDLRDDGRA